jgi:hypothetical protein
MYAPCCVAKQVLSFEYQCHTKCFAYEGRDVNDQDCQAAIPASNRYVLKNCSRILVRLFENVQHINIKYGRLGLIPGRLWRTLNGRGE